MKQLGRKCLLIPVLVFLIFLIPSKAQAGSGVIQFTTSQPEIAKGDTFTVVCQVTSTEAFLDAEFQIVYDAGVLEFVKGGNKVSGGNGVLYVASTGNETSSYKKTFSLQFKAVDSGDTALSVDGDIKITDEDGAAFSVSSNQLVIEVQKKKAAASATPKVSSAPTKSTKGKSSTQSEPEKSGEPTTPKEGENAEKSATTDKPAKESSEEPMASEGSWESDTLTKDTVEETPMPEESAAPATPATPKESSAPTAAAAGDNVLSEILIVLIVVVFGIMIVMIKVATKKKDGY
jgi:hypothetical protein